MPYIGNVAKGITQMNTFTQLDSIISDLQANGKEVKITKLPNSTRYKKSLYGVKKAKSIRQKVSA